MNVPSIYEENRGGGGGAKKKGGRGGNKKSTKGAYKARAPRPPCFESRVPSQLAAKFCWKVGFCGKLLQNNQVTSTMSTGNAIAGSQ